MITDINRPWNTRRKTIAYLLVKVSHQYLTSTENKIKKQKKIFVKYINAY